ncbi:MAG: carboxypeptidase regulatory-like domain-containing protein, partial [Deltaproteobacteria bacterium]
LLLLASLALALGLAGCSGDSGSDTTPDSSSSEPVQSSSSEPPESSSEPPTSAPPFEQLPPRDAAPFPDDFLAQQPPGRIGIRVLDEDGEPLVGAQVAVDGRSTLSDTLGDALLGGIGRGIRTVTVTAPGYLHAVRRLDLRDGGIARDTVYLSRQADPVPFDAADGAAVADGPLDLDFAPGTIVTLAGEPFDGTVVARVRDFDPAPEERWRYPVPLEAELVIGENGYLETFGMFSATLEAEDGTPLQIAAGQTVEVRREAPEGAEVGDRIPMWHFDEGRGLWIEVPGVESEVVIGENGRREMVVEIPHLSLWNFDVFFGAGQCRFRVTFPDAIPVDQRRNWTVDITTPGRNGATTQRTRTLPSEGFYDIVGFAPGDWILRLRDPANTVIDEQEVRVICPGENEVELSLGDLEFEVEGGPTGINFLIELRSGTCAVAGSDLVLELRGLAPDDRDALPDTWERIGTNIARLPIPSTGQPDVLVRGIPEHVMAVVYAPDPVDRVAVRAVRTRPFSPDADPSQRTDVIRMFFPGEYAVIPPGGCAPLECTGNTCDACVEVLVVNAFGLPLSNVYVDVSDPVDAGIATGEDGRFCEDLAEGSLQLVTLRSPSGSLLSFRPPRGGSCEEGNCARRRLVDTDEPLECPTGFTPTPTLDARRFGSRDPGYLADGEYPRPLRSGRNRLTNLRVQGVAVDPLDEGLPNNPARSPESYGLLTFWPESPDRVHAAWRLERLLSGEERPTSIELRVPIADDGAEATHGLTLSLDTGPRQPRTAAPIDLRDLPLTATVHLLDEDQATVFRTGIVPGDGPDDWASLEPGDLGQVTFERLTPERAIIRIEDARLVCQSCGDGVDEPLVTFRLNVLADVRLGSVVDVDLRWSNQLSHALNGAWFGVRNHGAPDEAADEDSSSEAFSDLPPLPREFSETIYGPAGSHAEEGDDPAGEVRWCVPTNGDIVQLVGEPMDGLLRPFGPLMHVREGRFQAFETNADTPFLQIRPRYWEERFVRAIYQAVFRELEVPPDPARTATIMGTPFNEQLQRTSFGGAELVDRDGDVIYTAVGLTNTFDTVEPGDSATVFAFLGVEPREFDERLTLIIRDEDGQELSHMRQVIVPVEGGVLLTLN